MRIEVKEDLGKFLEKDIKKEYALTQTLKAEIYRGAIKFIETDVKKNAPRYRNRLYHSIRTTGRILNKNHIRYEIASKGLTYAYKMEYGSRPYEIEDFNALKKWVYDQIITKGKARGIVAKIKNLHQRAGTIAYFIKRKHKRFGMKGKHFFKKAFSRRNINKMTRRIKRILGAKKK